MPAILDKLIPEDPAAELPRGIFQGNKAGRALVGIGVSYAGRLVIQLGMGGETHLNREETRGKFVDPQRISTIAIHLSNQREKILPEILE